MTYSHEPDKVVETALRARNFQLIEEMTGFGLSLEGWSSDLHIPGFEVRPVRSEDDMEAYREVALAGFGIPDSLAEIFCKIFADSPRLDKSFQHYIAYMDGVPVTTVTAFTENGATGIYNVATPEAYRRRGYARTALACVLRDVRNRGVKKAVIIATPMARSVYPSVGFREELTIKVFSNS